MEQTVELKKWAKEPFEKRASEYEKRLVAISKELGVVPWATLQHSPEAIISVAILKDLWESSKDSKPSGK